MYSYCGPAICTWTKWSVTFTKPSLICILGFCWHWAVCCRMFFCGSLFSTWGSRRALLCQWDVRHTPSAFSLTRCFSVVRKEKVWRWQIGLTWGLLLYPQHPVCSWDTGAPWPGAFELVLRIQLCIFRPNHHTRLYMSSGECWQMAASYKLHLLSFM